jgi:hypothetical protein
LDEMSAQEKLDRTTRENLALRWVLLWDQRDYYISKNEMPYPDTKEHLVLWIDNFSEMTIETIKYFSSKWYEVRLNPTDKQSVQRLHFHLIKR